MENKNFKSKKTLKNVEKMKYLIYNLSIRKKGEGSMEEKNKDIKEENKKVETKNEVKKEDTKF